MFIKSLLIVVVLIGCSVDGMVENGMPRLPPRPEFREVRSFLDVYSNLIQSVKNQTNLAEEQKNGFENTWEEIRDKLTGKICDGCVIDCSGNANSELASLVGEKSRDLRKKAEDTFEDLRKALEGRDHAIGKWFLSKAERAEKEVLGGLLTDLKSLKNFFNGLEFADYVERLFQEARARGALRGNDDLRDWFDFYREHRSNSCFSSYLLLSFNQRAEELSRELRSSQSNETMLKLARWKEQFTVMRSLNFPTRALRLSDCLLPETSMLVPYLKGISSGWKNLIAIKWLNSLNPRLQISRCKFFIPVVSVENIEGFFCSSGGTCHTESVKTLLRCGSSQLLDEVLWGAPISTRRTHKGLILDALLTETGECRSYLNAALIITDLEELCSERASEEYVRKIVDFLKFVTGEDLAGADDEGHSHFPYLGVDVENRDVGNLNLKWFNVVLSTTKSNFSQIHDGISGKIGLDAADALKDRLNAIALTQEEESLESAMQSETED